MQINRNFLLSCLCIFLIIIIALMYTQNRHQSSSDKIAGSINEVTEEIVDEIDDNTTRK